MAPTEGTGPAPLRPAALVVLSRSVAFTTLAAGDLDGPTKRARAVMPDGVLPRWAAAFRRAPEKQAMVVVASGSARAGTTTRIRSIILYPKRGPYEERAYVYVETRDTGSRVGGQARPFHVVACESLPSDVRFVDVEQTPPKRAPLRVAARSPS